MPVISFHRANVNQKPSKKMEESSEDKIEKPSLFAANHNESQESKNLLLRNMLTQNLENRSRHEITLSCMMQLKAISIIADAKGDKALAKDNLTKVKFALDLNDQQINDLVSLFENRREGYFSQNINRTAAKYVEVLRQTLDTIAPGSFRSNFDTHQMRNISSILNESSKWYRGSYIQNVSAKINNTTNKLNIQLGAPDGSMGSLYRLDIDIQDMKPDSINIQENNNALPPKPIDTNKQIQIKPNKENVNPVKSHPRFSNSFNSVSSHKELQTIQRSNSNEGAPKVISKLGGNNSYYKAPYNKIVAKINNGEIKTIEELNQETRLEWLSSQQSAELKILLTEKLSANNLQANKLNKPQDNLQKNVSNSNAGAPKAVSQLGGNSLNSNEFYNKTYKTIETKINNGEIKTIEEFNQEIRLMRLQNKQITTLRALVAEKLPSNNLQANKLNKPQDNLQKMNIIYFKSKQDLDSFIQRRIDDNNEFDIIDKRDNFLKELEQSGYSTTVIENNGYTDICYNETDKKFELTKDHKLQQADVSKISVGVSDLKDVEHKNEISKLNLSKGYAAPKEQITKLRQEVSNFVIGDKANYKTYLSALVAETSIQFAHTDSKDDAVWSDQEDMVALSNNATELAKKLKTRVFPECRSREELIALLNDREEMINRFEIFAETIIEHPETLINENIAREFCKHKGIDFDQITLKDNHFYPKNGNPEDILSNGDCFFHTISKLMME